MTAVATSLLVWSSLAASSFVALMFLLNLLFFRKPQGSPRPLSAGRAPAGRAPAGRASPGETPEISVLIPARNEALRIAPLLDSVLASEGVRCEVCVLDDESQDGTAAIVQEYARRDPRVRLLEGTPVPVGWSGKQFACYQLAGHATHEELVFLDADVSLAKHGLRDAVDQRRQSGVDLLSGFPRQRVVTLGEQLLIPLIHVILLCFLPFALMRWTRMSGAAAGCGQLFLTTRAAYRRTGGHSAIKQSLHDGIMLPRAYRKSGLKTDVCDASDLAACRMYASFPETWSGLLKNAGEGFARLPLLPAITLLMLAAFVCPVFCLAAVAAGGIDAAWLPTVLTACVMSYLPRLLCSLKFDRAWLACALHPASILLFLAIQWTALVRKSLGRGVQWRQREYAAVAS